MKSLPVLRCVQRRACAKFNFIRDRPFSAGSANEEEAELRNKIIDTAIRSHVLTVGWTDEAIVRAVGDLGYPAHTHKILSRGPVELVQAFLVTKREKVFQEILKSDLFARTKKDSDDKREGQNSSYATSLEGRVLQEAITLHLEEIKPYIHTWPAAIALLADPPEIRRSLGIGSEVVEDFCTMIQIQEEKLEAVVDAQEANNATESRANKTRDQFSRKAALMTVYTSTELFMLQDKSMDFADTREFLSRAIRTYEETNDNDSIISNLQLVVLSYLGQVVKYANGK